MLILAAKLRMYTKHLDSSFSGKRCLSIENHKPQTSYSGKRRDEMFRDEAYEMGSEVIPGSPFCRGWISNLRTEPANFESGSVVSKVISGFHTFLNSQNWILFLIPIRIFLKEKNKDSLHRRKSVISFPRQKLLDWL